MNDGATKGLVVVAGHLKKHDGSYLKSQVDRIPDLLKNYSADQNILFVQLNEKDISLEQLGEEIKKFADVNDEISIISGIHGLHPFSLEGEHILQFGESSSFFEDSLPGIFSSPAMALDYVRDYLVRDIYVSSAEYFETVVEATHGKLASVWQTSCQGSLLIPKLEKILPDGVKLYTETDRFHMYPEGTLDALIKNIVRSEEIDFDNMIADVSDKIAYINSISDKEYQDYSMFFSPIKTIIGKEQFKYASLVNDLIYSGKTHFDQQKYADELTVQKSAKFKYSFEKQCSAEKIGSAIEILRNVEDFDFNKCAYGHGNAPWIHEQVHSIFGLGPDAHDCPVDSAMYLDLLACVTVLGEDHPFVSGEDLS